MKNGFLIFTALFVLGLPGLHARLSVSSSFEPGVVRAGEAAMFRIDFSSDTGSRSLFNSAPPRVPAVEGLRLQYIGPSHETRIVNGQTSVRVSHLYRALATTPGVYTVPAFEFVSGSIETEIPEAVLEVIDSGTSPTGNNEPSSRPAWLEVTLPRENLYVGETTPIGVRLYLNNQKVDDASLRTDHPEKVGDAFSIGEFSQMSQDRGALNGLPVTVADWTVLLTPLKTGTQPLLFELPLAVRLRTPSRGADPFDSLFGGRSPFGGMFQREGIRAYSDDQEVEILPLPTANRPGDFTGGIGRFQVEQTRISSPTVQVGEPLLFSVEISGQGNFNRLEAPVLQSDEAQWRSYSPEISFTPRDNLGYAGVKSFTFTVIPRAEGITSTPEFTFSYFDPEKAEYQSVTVPPTTIEVTPAPAGSLRPRAESDTANPVEARRGPDLLPLQKNWSGTTHSLRAPFTSTGFLATQATLFVLLVAAYLILRHQRRLEEDPDYARRNRARRASRRFLKEATSHAATGETGAFYRTARRAIQECVGPFQNGEPESLTENEVLAILEKRGLAEPDREEVHRYFATAESIEYGGRAAAAVDLHSENLRLRELLKTLLSRKAARPPKSSSGVASAASLLVVFALLAFHAPGLSAQEPPADNGDAAADSAKAISDSTAARSVFERAVESYDAGEFQDAVQQFGSLLPDFSSPEVHYNLANALYRLRDYPEAILHYERAFALSPANPDIQANLNLAREAASLEAPQLPPLAFIGHRLSWQAWTWLLSIAFWGLVATLLLSRPAKIPGLWRKALALLFGLLFVSSVLAQITWFSTANQAIILTSDAPLRIAPTASSPLETRLTAGSTVDAGEIYGDFQRARLHDGTQGWVLKSSIAPVRK